MAANHDTRLARVLDLLGVKPRHLIEVANEIASELGEPKLSRQHLLRLRERSRRATEGRMLLIVAALREITGFFIRASDLFDIEPPLPAGAAALMPRLSPEVPDGCTAALPVSSLRRATSAWRPSLSGSATPPHDTLDALYEQYGVLLRSIAMRRYRVPPDDAEALVHDTFIAYMQRRNAVREVKPWLMGAVGHACKHYWRDRKREAPLPDGIEQMPDIAADVGNDQVIDRLSVAAALARLGDKCRETLHRYYFREETKESIAHALSTSPAYVLQLLVSCRRRVREFLDRQEGPKKP